MRHPEILADLRTRYDELEQEGEFVTEDAPVDPAEDLAETHAALLLGTSPPTCGTDRIA